MTSPASPPYRVAIVKPCCIGDCIMALPALDALMAAWPSAQFDTFVGHHSRAVFSFRPAISTRVIPETFDVQSALRLARRLRRGRYDAVISLDRSRWLRLAVTLSRASTTNAPGRHRPEMRHESEVYLDVVRHLGVPTPFGIPVISPDPETLADASSLVSGITRRFAVLHPGGARNPGVEMLNKRWPADRWVQLARALERDGIDVVLSGGPDDFSIAQHVASGSDLPASRILAGKANLLTLAALLQRAAVFVGPDTGVSHLAAAVGTPTIAIFGPTNPRRYRPLGPCVQVVAPPASWQIADRDLRRSPNVTSAISTSDVAIDDVVSATRSALSQPERHWPCSS